MRSELLQDLPADAARLVDAMLATEPVEDPITVFAPTDEAWAELVEGWQVTPPPFKEIPKVR